MMPIITPCYPPMNSSYNVGEPQLRRLRDELGRASELSDDVLAGRKTWDVLFEGNDFFKHHHNYLQVCVCACYIYMNCQTLLNVEFILIDLDHVLLFNYEG